MFGVFFLGGGLQLFSPVTAHLAVVHRSAGSVQPFYSGALQDEVIVRRAPREAEISIDFVILARD